MTTIQYIQLGRALMLHMYGMGIEIYLYGLTWFEDKPMPFPDQPICLN